MTIHHRWQGAHDKLEEVESFRESSNFERKLNHYRGSPLTKLLDLVKDELNQASAQQATRADIGQLAVTTNVRHDSPRGTNVNNAGETFINDLLRLKVCLETLRSGASVLIFDDMRKHMDDAFYYVDKRTSNEVGRAMERVAKLEEWLDSLVVEGKKAIGHSD